MNAQAGQLLQAALALGTVVLSVFLLSSLARHFPALRGTGKTNDAAPALRGTLALDTRRRLHLIETQGRQVLVLTGGVTDVVVHLPPSAS